MKPVEYDKEKHCPQCKGVGHFSWPLPPKPPLACHMCRQSGELFVYLKISLESLQKRFDNLEERKGEEIKALDSWIQKISICKTCKGNRHTTPGGCPCKECGLIGDQPWGGQ